MSGQKILIVEDEPITFENEKEMLEELGYEVVGTVAIGEQAIEMVVNDNPDLVLMDIKLSGKMDGIEVAQKIHDQFEIPVIYITAFTDPTLLARAKLTEPFGYIVKPFQKQDLQANIEMALYRYQMEKKLKQALDEAERLNTTCMNREIRIKELRDEVKMLKSSSLHLSHAS